MRRIILLLTIIGAGTSTYSQNFNWAKRIGASSNYDNLMSIARNDAGDYYCTGYFSGTVDFDPGPGVYNLSSAGANVFILKLDMDGDFLWAVQFGSTMADYGHSVDVDSYGNVVVTGYYQGLTDFDPGPANVSYTPVGLIDMFITKFDSFGNLIWVKSIGGSGGDYGTAVDIDYQNNILFTGYFSGTVDFNPGAAIYNLATGGAANGFVCKLDPTGNFIWAKQIGSNSSCRANTLSCDQLNAVVVGGYFIGTGDFDPGVPNYNMVSEGMKDAFIVKLDSNGNFEWGKQVGGISDDVCNVVGIDNLNNVWIGIDFTQTVDFNPNSGVYNLTSSGSIDASITKLNSTGGFLMAQKFGGISNDGINGLSFNPNNDVNLIGYYSDLVDFDNSSSSTNMLSAGGSDIFATRISNTGTLLWVKSFGSSEDDIGVSVASSLNSEFCFSGQFNQTVDFNPGLPINNLTSAGNWDICMVNLVCNSIDTIALSTCDFYIVNNDTIYVDGLYVDTLFNMHGCDSLILFDLNINNSAQYGQTPVICQGSYFEMNGNTYYSSGIYVDTLITSNGCDSIVTTNLSVVDCSSVDNVAKVNFSAYPNPFNNQIAVSSTLDIFNSVILIRNSVGMIVFEKQVYLIEQTPLFIQLDHLESGVYFLTISNSTIPLIKQ